MGPRTAIGHPSDAPAVLGTIASWGVMLDVIRALGESGFGDSPVAATMTGLEQRLLVYIWKIPTTKAWKRSARPWKNAS